MTDVLMLKFLPLKLPLQHTSLSQIMFVMSKKHLYSPSVWWVLFRND